MSVQPFTRPYRCLRHSFCTRTPSHPCLPLAPLAAARPVNLLFSSLWSPPPLQRAASLPITSSHAFSLSPTHILESRHLTGLPTTDVSIPASPLGPRTIHSKLINNPAQTPCHPSLHESAGSKQPIGSIALVDIGHRGPASTASLSQSSLCRPVRPSQHPTPLLLRGSFFLGSHPTIPTTHGSPLQTKAALKVADPSS